jgi:hypothetical protein
MANFIIETCIVWLKEPVLDEQSNFKPINNQVPVNLLPLCRYPIHQKLEISLWKYFDFSPELLAIFCCFSTRFHLLSIISSESYAVLTSKAMRIVWVLTSPRVFIYIGWFLHQVQTLSRGSFISLEGIRGLKSSMATALPFNHTMNPQQLLTALYPHCYAPFQFPSSFRF